ncbi:hypothetical protein, partial [Bacillus mycoides]|uniref:hypothetical protein n=1 Tax=Bacillus mycoides TaxID=1405 RepID=UPI001CB9774D
LINVYIELYISNKKANVNFSILVYFQIPLIIEFIPIPLISSKLARKLYIQNTTNKEVSKPMNKQLKN